MIDHFWGAGQGQHGGATIDGVDHASSRRGAKGGNIGEGELWNDRRRSEPMGERAIVNRQVMENLTT